MMVPLIRPMYMLMACYFLLGALINPLSTRNRGCKCVPDKWTGLLSSTERKFYQNSHINNGKRQERSELNQYLMLMSYDYTNRIFVMEDHYEQSIALADYNEGYKYLIRGEHCHAIETKEKMRKMCLPDNADLRGEFMLGDETPVEVWQFQGPMNMSMRTTVVKDTCMPISEEVAMTAPDYASVTTSYYFNVKFDAEQKVVKPDNCMFSKVQDMKRGSREHAMLEDILHQFQHQ